MLTEKEYDKVMARIWELMNTTNKEEEKELERLAILAEEYESQFWSDFDNLQYL